jgi:hypothetical protein
MGGLVIDVYAAFIIKYIWRTILRIKSSKWKRISATLRNATVESGWCPIVRMTFNVGDTDSLWDESVEIPFLFVQVARRYAAAHHPGQSITIREDSTSTERLFFENDQAAR